MLGTKLTSSRWARPLLYGGACLVAGLVIWWGVSHLPERQPSPFGGDRTGEKDGVRFWSGPESGITERCYLRITSREEWKRVWRRHCDKWTPRIDFGDQMVVAVFQGKGWNNDGVMLASLDEDQERVRLRITNRYYQTAGPPPDLGMRRVTAYGIFAVPRSLNPLVLEEDVRQDKDSPCLFRERARFPRIRPEDAGIAKGSVEISADQVVDQRAGPGGWAHSPPRAEVDSLPRLVVGQPLPGQGVGFQQAIGRRNLPSAYRQFASAEQTLAPGAPTFLILRTDPLRGADYFHVAAISRGGADYFHVAAISRDGNAFNIRCERWRYAEDAPNARLATRLLLIPLGELQSGSYAVVVSRTAGTWADYHGGAAEVEGALHQYPVSVEGPLPPYRITFEVAATQAPAP